MSEAIEVIPPSVPSKKYSLNKLDGIKIAKGLGIAMAGATLTYLSSVVPDIDFGAWTPVVTALFAVLVNAALRFLSGNPK